MRYRKLSADGDMVFGGDQAAFYKDQAEAPAQAAMTRLQLFQGEWFLDITDGTPWNTRVLGNRTASTRDPVLRSRILGTQGISAISAYASQLNRSTRAFSVQATIETEYGPIDFGAILRTALKEEGGTLATPPVVIPPVTPPSSPSLDFSDEDDSQYLLVL